MRAGRVVEIWRFPVKSMGGGRLDDCRIDSLGLPGDRGWALRDEEAREIRGAKKFPALLRCAARYVEEPSDGRIPGVEIELPDGSRTSSDDPRVNERLSELVGRRVTLHPRRPRDDAEHYRRRLPEEPEALERDLREMFGRTKDEPLPNLAIFPTELVEFTSPRGTYFDAFPIHVVTTATLRKLESWNPAARFDPRRFRPNFLVDCDGVGLAELDWNGKRVRIGEAEFAIEMPVVRCSMVTQPQGDLPKDPSVLRTIVREADQNVGVYASVVTPGRVAVGDAVEVG